MQAGVATARAKQPWSSSLPLLAEELTERLPGVRVYWVDPGDMRTQMHQAAFPGEDISDRPLPEASVPGLLALLDGDWPNGRYQAQNFPMEAVA